jgi:acyl-CoA dehydrogenase
MGRKASTRTSCSSTGFEIPVEDRIGEEGKGFEYILHGMNPERILIAAEAVGLGRALARATPTPRSASCSTARSARTRRSSIRWRRTGWSSRRPADDDVGAWQYDNGLPCGAAANAAKYLAGEAGFNACQQAVMTHGGFGYAKEYHVERYLREVIPRIAPISPQLMLCFIAERVLGLPKSY